MSAVALFRLMLLVPIVQGATIGIFGMVQPTPAPRLRPRPADTLKCLVQSRFVFNRGVLSTRAATAPANLGSAR